MQLHDLTCSSLPPEPNLRQELFAELRRTEARLKKEIKEELLAELDVAKACNRKPSDAFATSNAADREVCLDDVEVAADDEGGAVQDSTSFEGSVWDSTLICGAAPLLGSAGSAFTSVLVVLNILIQASFAVIVRLTVVNSPSFTSRTIEALRDWRRNIAHDIANMDPITHKSLALRVCQDDAGLAMSASQAQTFSELNTYFQRSVGPIMCSLSLLCWFLSVSREINRCVDFSLAVKAIPLGDRTVIAPEDGFRLVSASRKRITCVLAAQAVRLAIAVALLFSGVDFLVDTISIGDLLLNSGRDFCSCAWHAACLSSADPDPRVRPRPNLPFSRARICHQPRRAHF